MNAPFSPIGMIVDPPSGWRYGFPKLFTPRYTGQALTEWLLEQGLPQDLIDIGHVRIWSGEPEVNPVPIITPDGPSAESNDLKRRQEMYGTHDGQPMLFGDFP